MRLLSKAFQVGLLSLVPALLAAGPGFTPVPSSPAPAPNTAPFSVVPQVAAPVPQAAAWQVAPTTAIAAGDSSPPALRTTREPLQQQVFAPPPLAGPAADSAGPMVRGKVY